MIYGLYLSTAGAKAQSQRQDVISNNIANVDTTGFRRMFATARQRLDRQSELGTPLSGLLNDPRQTGGGVHLFRTENDLDTIGPIKPSSANSHMAINGKGFFRVRLDGETYLTRNGAFTFGSDGTLRTNDSNATLLSKEGSPVKLDPNRPFEVGAGNVVVQDGKKVATLAVVYPNNLDSIERAGDSLLRYDGRDRPCDGEVKQNFLESSNVDSVREMVELIESARGFEMNIQMIQLQNDTLGRLVEQVARPS